MSRFIVPPSRSSDANELFNTNTGQHELSGAKEMDSRADNERSSPTTEKLELISASSLSDDLLANHCMGEASKEVESHPDTDIEEHCKSTSSQSSIFDDLMANRQSKEAAPNDIGPRLRVEDTEKCSSTMEQFEFEVGSSISDDLLVKHCGIIVEDTEKPNSALADVYDDVRDKNDDVIVHNKGGLSTLARAVRETKDNELHVGKKVTSRHPGTNDVMYKHDDVIEESQRHPITFTRAIGETEDIDQHVHKRTDKRGSNRNQPCDDLIGEFDSCPGYQSTGLLNPSGPSARSENEGVLSSSSNLSSSMPNVEDQKENENSGSFSLNLSLSESIGDDECEPVVDLNSKKEEGRRIMNSAANEDDKVKLQGQKLKDNEGENKTKIPDRPRQTLDDHHSNIFDMIGVATESLDERKNGRRNQLTKIKAKDKQLVKKTSVEAGKSSRETPIRDQERSLGHQTLVVETPESDLTSQVAHSNQSSASGSRSSGSKVTASNQTSDSTPGSPCVDSPASPSCTFTSVSVIDVSANDLLFHTFMKEWKTRKEFSFAVGCERLLDNVPKIGGRFNKSPKVNQGPSKGLPIEGTDEVVVGVAVCWSGKNAFYISLKDCDDVTSDVKNHDESMVAPNLSVTARIEGIKSVLEYKGKRKGMKFCFDSTAQYKVCFQYFSTMFPLVPGIRLQYFNLVTAHVRSIKLGQSRTQSPRFSCPAAKNEGSGIIHFLRPGFLGLPAFVRCRT